ncbi:rhodanese-like domain-containing protein [Phaeobacter sp. HS012]|uniref:rhodanese-like domain-containing protein n=1 Tax=unclassified Phaeobacter TaxID=2621772 RepID=UPI001B36A862|nr:MULTISPECIES: rhodanese-like domain-containing protein [unclassified Phaeobacter]MBQ4805987.1 rhodanese-like domain-containing protein [Phaeobacter sp. HS012]MBQ4880837.1 rhodanese-like domain-containing protein [Phaeobacter sp. HS011]
MTFSMSKSYKDLIAEAEAIVMSISPAEAADLHDRDDSLFVDLRVIREVERTGVIPGALSCPRGLMEFWIDPSSPYHKPVFAEDRAFIFYCDNGWRSALAARTALEMGLQRAVFLKGGFDAWIADGGDAIPYKW